MSIAEEYANEVKNGRITVGKYTRLAIERYYSDLDRSKKDKNWGYVHHSELAKRYINFFKKLKHGKGKWRGTPFNLMPWAAFILWNAYGWTKRGTINRRFREVYIKVARKNAKTELMAGVGMCGFYVDAKVYGEKDPEIYWYATKKEQAKIGWDRQYELTKMLRADSEDFANYCGTSTYGIFTNDGSGKVAYLGKDSKTEDGWSPYYGIGDEKHAQRTDDMDNVIRSGMGSRENWMMWNITTAGTNPECPCAQFERICKQILEGVIENDLIFAMIFDIDKDDDWNDPGIRIKANPAIEYIDTLEGFLEDEYLDAKTKGAKKQISFLTKNLNQWTTVQEAWITDDLWMKGRAADLIDINSLKGRKCYGFLDLASKRDTTSLCLLFPPESEDDTFKVLWWYWLPEMEAKEREKNNGIPYTQWEADGWINLTPGNSVDFAYILRTIAGVTYRDDETPDAENCVANLYDIVMLGRDRWREEQIITWLEDEGIKSIPLGQGYKSMTVPTEMMLKFVLDGKLQHGGNPVSRWQCSNIVIDMDPAESIKITKAKSRPHHKVDGMVALVGAIAMYLDDQKKKEGEGDSVYNTRGVYIIGE